MPDVRAEIAPAVASELSAAMRAAINAPFKPHLGRRMCRSPDRRGISRRSGGAGAVDLAEDQQLRKLMADDIPQRDAKGAVPAAAVYSLTEGGPR